MNVYDVRRWLPVDAPLTNGADARSPEALRAVLAQFDVVHNKRYSVEREGKVTKTWCNIFVSDATRALKCEIPHWVDSKTGNPAPLPSISSPHDEIARAELTANDTCKWLAVHGTRFGWSFIDQSLAGAFAARGMPVVAAWANSLPGRPGHVAMLLPPVRTRLHIAQAGANNLFDAPIEAGFGNLRPLFYSHP